MFQRVYLRVAKRTEFNHRFLAPRVVFALFSSRSMQCWWDLQSAPTRDCWVAAKPLLIHDYYGDTMTMEYIYVYIYMYIYMYICVCIYICIYICICVYICIYICIYICTYTGSIYIRLYIMYVATLLYMLYKLGWLPMLTSPTRSGMSSLARQMAKEVPLFPTHWVMGEIHGRLTIKIIGSIIAGWWWLEHG